MYRESGQNLWWDTYTEAKTNKKIDAYKYGKSEIVLIFSRIS